MKLDKFLTSIGLTIGTVLFVSNSAQAASFTTNVTQENGATGDVFLDSITQNDRTINRFSFVESAEIIENDEYDGGNTGAASTDRGDAIDDLTTNEDPEADEIANFLGNNNLNNIIDTEDDGAFKMNLFFDSVIRADNTGLDSLFFWERGMNSDLQVQAIDENGDLIGNAIKLLKFKDRDRDNEFRQIDAGFQIDTTEIEGAQKVGSWGVSLAQLGLEFGESLSGIQVSAEQSFKGPDFKVIARRSGTDFARASVPEPGTIIGLGSFAALAFVRRRKSK